MSSSPAGDTGWPAPQFPTVATVPAARAGRAGRRWQRALLSSGGIALALALLAAALLLFVFVAGAAPSATEAGYRYVRDDAAYAVELRFDMPAGQRTELAELLRGVPGFGGDVTFAERVNEMLDEAVEDVAGPEGDYLTDVAPWFEGWAVLAGPAGAIGELDGPGGLLVLGVRDRDAAEASLRRLRGEGDWSAEEYRGSIVWSAPDSDGPAPGAAADAPAAYAVTDDAVLLAASAGEVRRALDTAAGEAAGLLSVPAFADRWRSQPAGRLAAFWLDAEQLDELPTDLPGHLGGSPLPTNPFGAGCADHQPRPESLSGVVFARDGRAHVELAARYADGADLPVSVDRNLAGRVPSDAFLYAELRDVGSAAKRLGECLDSAGAGEGAERLREMERRLGSLDELAGWAGDAAIVARWDEARLSGGLLIAVGSRARATDALGRLRADLTDANEHGPVTVSEETYAGVTVVDVTFTEGFDEGAEMGPPAPDAVVSYALAEDVLVIGVDGSFTRAVLDTTAETSLRSDATFRQLVELAGGFGNSGMAYLDAPTAVAVAEAFEAAADNGDRGAGDIDNAWLRSVEGVVAVARVDGRVVVTRIVLAPID